MNPTSVSGTIVQEITIKGPAERIFEALTNPDERMKWWGAEGKFQTTQMESDLRPGGKWVMRAAAWIIDNGSFQLLRAARSRGMPNARATATRCC